MDPNWGAGSPEHLTTYLEQPPERGPSREGAKGSVVPPVRAWMTPNRLSGLLDDAGDGLAEK
jgi:hypothetical protein